MTKYFDENGIECDKENAHSARTENEDYAFFWIKKRFLWFEYWSIDSRHEIVKFGTKHRFGMEPPKKQKPIVRPD